MKELKEKAKIIAEGTGRTYESVLEDLLDDGVVNLSNEQLKQGSLVEQLKEAAELIATVQNISKEVEKNTVLNSKDVTTEVEVNSTLEGDCVDRAIESVQRKADNIKKILLTLAPVFLLLTTGGMEYFAITDFIGDEASDSIILGCLDQNAINYDQDANEDDETCIPPPDCNPEWIYEDNSRAVNDADLLVAFKFTDNEDCDITINGHFIISLVSNGELYDEDTIDVGYFSNEVVVTQEFNDLEDGTYEVLVELHELECNDGTCSHGPNWNMDPTTINIEIIIKGCMDQGANNYNPDATEDDGSCEFDPEECIAFFTNVGYQWENDTYGSVDLTVSFDADWSCEGEVSIGIDYYLKDKDGNEIQNESMFYETIGEQQDLKYFYSFSLSKPIDQSICLVLFYQDGDDWREDDEHNENLNR